MLKNIKEIADIKEKLVKEAFEGYEENASYEIVKLYSKLYLNEDLDAVNEKLIYVFTNDSIELRNKYFVHDHWSLILNPMLIRIYYHFGSQGLYKNRLYPETESALLDFLWERMLEKNDIHLARQSTWWMTGSENHDINAKACALITSQIFMHHPDYKDRIYPDTGTGGGTGYWFSQMYPKGVGFLTDGKSGHYDEKIGLEVDRGPRGRAQLKDGKEYCAKAHYDEWVPFWKEYLLERIKRGFFLEANSNGYAKWTLSFLSIIYEFVEDDSLKEMAKRFFDVVWAQWAQDQIDKRSGGARTRAIFNKDAQYMDSMHEMANFLTGESASLSLNLCFQFLSDYTLPQIVLDMIVNKDSMGTFEFYSRKPGEEEYHEIRPLGAERTLLCDTHSRLLSYSYVTPDLIMGTQMDHPMARHSHLSIAARHQNILLKGDLRALIYPSGIKYDNGNILADPKMYRSVQKKNVLVTQQSRGWTQVNPDWYPHNSMDSSEYGVFFDDEFELIEEKDGIVFVKHGRAFVAVRVAYGGYEWLKTRRCLRLCDRHAPVIFEVATETDFSYEEFVAKVNASLLCVNRTVVDGWCTIDFKSGITGDEFYFNAANNELPMFNGEYVNYAPDKTFCSPYIDSDYNSGVVTLKYGDAKEIIDFNRF